MFDPPGNRLHHSLDLVLEVAMDAPARPFFTIGHFTLSVPEFVEMLRPAEVRLVVDVRTVPRSRTSPQSNRDALPVSLVDAQVAYEHIAELGGLRGRQRSVKAERPERAGRRRKTVGSHCRAFRDARDEQVAGAEALFPEASEAIP